MSDDKGGLLAGVFALDALLSLGWDDYACVTFVCTPDEEIGSPGSRALLETLGAEHDVALCLECAREDGRVVVGRKGVVDVVLEVSGRSAHAGVEPERGVNAAVAAAGLTADLAALNGRWPDVTVNVGVLRAGERPNVVPARASPVADVRATSPTSFDEVVAAIRSLADRSSVGGVTVEMFLQAPAPPWVSDPASRRVADSNLLAAQGIAVLDGLGPVGGDDHSLTEWLDLDQRRAQGHAACWAHDRAGQVGRQPGRGPRRAASRGRRKSRWSPVSAGRAVVP